MALPQPILTNDAAPVRLAAACKARPSTVSSGAGAVDSRQLQALLGARLALEAEHAEGQGRWSRRRMLALAAAASCALWSTLAAGGYLLLRP